MVARTPALLARRLVGVALLLLLGAFVTWLVAIRWAPSRSRYPVQGIDISQAQGSIDWRKARAAGVDFAYIKASGGAEMRDDRFADNWQQSRDAGVRRGAYHAFTLCRLARDQATNFIATVPRDSDALPVALDLDFGGNCTARPDRKVLLGEIALFIQMVEAHSGKAMILHLTPDFEDAYQISGAINRSLWLSRTGLAPAYGARPWVVWQASHQRRIDGIGGRVNWDVLQP